MNSYVNQLVDEQHAAIDAQPETIGYQIVSETTYNRTDPLNLPLYRHTVMIDVRWTDEYTRRPLTDHFYGYGPDWETAQAQAKEEYATWIARMNSIGVRRFQSARLAPVGEVR
jgi:hypothetical protein